MADKLSEYRDKRDFKGTPEPEGKVEEPGERARFVVQEHDASHLHWDLRLERDGVLVSWALPKGIPRDPKQNKLAVHTEDHPLEYLTFHGEIPKGSYGAGRMTVWDSGTYETEKFRKDEVMVTFHGERLTGKYVLFQTEGKNWMIHRMDPPENGALEPMPEQIKPMLAKLTELPRDEAAYGYEIKWDGIRALYFSEHGHTRMQNRNLKDVTKRYPELRTLGRSIGAHDVVLDGEVVALNDEGKPNFGLLQHRMHLASDAAVKRRMKDIPVTYMIFDLLYLDGHSTMELPYTDRRKLLEQLELDGECWRTPVYHAGEGQAVLDASKAQVLEGIVAKRLDSSYEPAARGGAWLKIKNKLEQEFVIAGWLPGQGRRGKTLGSLALGYYENGDLVYAGNVGTGFNEEMLTTLMKLLEPLAEEKSAFQGRQPPKEAKFVRPELVCEVVFGEWTADKTIRHPTFKGLRDDKSPQDVVLEAESEHEDAGA